MVTSYIQAAEDEKHPVMEPSGPRSFDRLSLCGGEAQKEIVGAEDVGLCSPSKQSHTPNKK